MSSKNYFNYLVEKNNPVGEVVSINRHLVTLRGLQPVNLRALIMFEDGTKGIVREVRENAVTVMHLGARPLPLGTNAVVQHSELVTKVGASFIGRVINVTGEPLDGEGAIAADEVWPVFHDAPGLIERQQITDQLETGITAIDAMFPLVLGQRIAIIGDSKSGKSSIGAQIALNQKGTDRVVVYCLIAKRRSDITDLLNRLQDNEALENAIVVVATMFDALPMSWLAPYVACSMAEYLWQKQNRDVVLIYDDLTNHAQVHREIALLSEVNPGRDAYPGDMFFAHSSLLERAGKLASNQKTLTALPIVQAPGGDITGYLPTNIMSITDGQYIIDMENFHQGVRPAISTTLSVSRVGGRGQSAHQKSLAARVTKQLARYKEALELSHFGSELALEAKSDLAIGKRLQEVMTQTPNEYFSIMAQSLMLEAALNASPDTLLDVNAMKLRANELAQTVKDDATFKAALQQLLGTGVMEVKK